MASAGGAGPGHGVVDGVDPHVERMNKRACCNRKIVQRHMPRRTSSTTVAGKPRDMDSRRAAALLTRALVTAGCTRMALLAAA
jgi:hypothetical protein